ncbi:MAG: ATP-binding protein [Actinomycetes bacterium]
MTGAGSGPGAPAAPGEVAPKTRSLSRLLVGDSLATRLRNAFGILVLLVAVVGGSGIGSLYAATSRLDRLSRGLAPAVDANNHALQLMLDAETGVRGYLLTDDIAFLTPYMQARDGVLAEIDRVEALAAKGGLDVDVSRERTAAQVWLHKYAVPAVATSGGQGTPSSAAGKQAFDRFRHEQSEVAQVIFAERQRVREEARAVRELAAPALVALTLLFVVLAGVVAGSCVRSVHGPLEQLRDVLERLRMGETSARASARGPREVRHVALATNALADEGDRLRAEQREATRMWRAARQSSRRVREELGRNQVLTAAARELGEVLGLDCAWIRYVDAEGDEPSRYAVQAQWCREGLDPALPLPFPGASARAALRQLWRNNEVYACPNVRTARELDSDDAHLLLALTDAQALLVVPVGGNDDVLAVAVLVHETPRDFRLEEVQAAQWVCGDLGRALEHSHLFEQQLELVDRLQELDRQKTDFLSTVSHELRTPLTSIAGYAELLRDGDAGPVTDEMGSMLEVIERNTVRLRSLIEDLLMLSRIESGVLRSTVGEVDMAEVVQSVVRSLRPQADAGGLRLSARTDGVDAKVSGDEMQLERVVLNLLSNAVKFTPAGGEVAVELEPAEDGDAVTVRVRDTGIGIPQAEQEQLFSRFFRASNAVQRAIPGTGLGLSIVRGIVEHHSGSFDLRSAPGEGTEVVVRLPLVRESQLVA